MPVFLPNVTTRHFRDNWFRAEIGTGDIMERYADRSMDNGNFIILIYYAVFQNVDLDTGIPLREITIRDIFKLELYKPEIEVVLTIFE